MNTTFNFNRFWKVMCNEWRLTWKSVLLFWGVLVAITSATVVLFIIISQGVLINRTAVMLSFFAILCLLQGFYLQFYFREFSSKTKTQALFLMPASQNETFWAKFSLGAIFYLLTTFVFIAIVVFFSGIVNEWLWNNGVSEFWINALSESGQPALYAESFLANQQEVIIYAKNILTFIAMWLIFVSGFLFGLFLFKKNAILKSFVFWTAVTVVLGYFICAVYFLFTGTFPAFASLGVIMFGGNESVCLNTMYPKLSLAVQAFIGLALIAISRVKYNEKTI